MVLFPHCKINLGLHVLRKRADGYHDLETVFYPLPLRDLLEIVPSGSGVAQTASIREQAHTTINFKTEGLSIPGDAGANLCVRGYHLLKKDFPQLPSLDAWLYKAIPMGAGLGGGSSDGAAMLRLLDSVFGLGLGREGLAIYAGQMGSDCAFFLYDQPCFASGRGEQLEPFALDLSGYSIVLVYPGIHVGTTEAFSELRPALPAVSLRELLAQPVSGWRSSLINDFEASVCKRYPELQKIKEKLYQCGAVYASMTGSGSAFYGLFRKEGRGMQKAGEPQGQESGQAKTERMPTANDFPGYFFRIL